MTDYHIEDNNQFLIAVEVEYVMIFVMIMYFLQIFSWRIFKPILAFRCIFNTN